MCKSPVHIQGDKLMEDRTFEENLVNDGMAQADAKVGGTSRRPNQMS